MRKIYLRQLVNLSFYLTLQVLIPSMLSLQGICFVWIGFLLFMPWVRHNMIWQLCLSFGLGLLVDIFYQTVGLHAFAAVFLLYCRNLFLYFFIVAPRKYKGIVTPNFTNLGMIKFIGYTFLFTLFYHGIVFLLDHQAIPLLLLHPSQFFLSILLSYFTVLFPSLCVEVIIRIYA